MALRKSIVLACLTAATTAVLPFAASAPAYACADVEDCLDQYVDPLTYPGGAPGLSSPSNASLNPAKMQAKYAQLAQNATAVTQLLVAGVNAPVPSESSVTERYRAPVVVMVHTQGLKWWESQGINQGFHALTIYLYHSSKGGGFSVYDSAFNTRKGITLDQMSKAGAPAEGAVAW